MLAVSCQMTVYTKLITPSGRQRPLFENFDAFQEIMRQFPQIQVVISSSWRETYKFDALLDFFPEDLQPQIIGATPVLPGSWRYEEVMQHRQQFSEEAPFLVIDDDQEQFPKNWPPLVLCNPLVGLDEMARQLLVERIQAMETTTK